MELKRLWQIGVLLLLVVLSATKSAEAANKKVKKCLQAAQSGRCFGYVLSYAYNPFTRKCEEFVYGGCGGNENRFETRTDCERNCRDI